MLPIPMLPEPKPPSSSSSRLRHRYKKKLEVWKLATAYLGTLNGLCCGSCGVLTESRSAASVSPQTQAAWAKTHRCALVWAARFARVRRGICPTGVQAVEELSKRIGVSSYSRAQRRRVAQVPLIADAIDEPSSNVSVSMLDALDPVEAKFYSEESSVIDPSGKSLAQFHELEEQFGFVGGDIAEYVKYFHRSDLPRDMWVWRLEGEVKAVGGFSTVEKKTAGR